MKEDLIRNNQGGLPRAGRGATVYILQCANGQYYVGSTTNIARRLDEQGSAMLAINPTILLRMNLVQRNIEVPARRRKETLATVGAQEVYEGTSACEAGLH